LGPISQVEVTEDHEQQSNSHLELKATLCLHGAVLLYNYSCLKHFSPTFCANINELIEVVTDWTIHLEVSSSKGNKALFKLSKNRFFLAFV
jgi:hypothetical protein